MKQSLSRFIAAVLLIAALLLPPMTTEAQRRRPRQRRADQQAQTTGSTQNTTAEGSTESTGRGRRGRRGRRGEAGRSVDAPTVVRQVNQATVPAAVVSTIRRYPVLLATVTIQANTIHPRSGYSMWQLTGGRYFIFEGEATPRATGYWRKEFPNGGIGWMICTCKEIGQADDPNDPCKFSGPSTADSPGVCGGAACCKTYAGYIESDGTLQPILTARACVAADSIHQD